MKKAYLFLFLCALFWGASGLLTQISLQYTTTMMLTSVRFIIAAIFALIFFEVKVTKKIIKHSLVLSILLVGIYTSSTYGLKYTSASNAGFIIGSNVVLVPLINKVFFKGRAKTMDYLRSLICLLGLGFVTLKGAQAINIGDFYCLVDAVLYSIFIIYSSNLSEDIDTKSLITMEYVFVAIFTTIYVLVFETFTLQVNFDNMVSIGILGVLCTFLTFYFQLSAQRKVSPMRTSQILALMPIFTVVFDMIFFSKMPTLYAIIGGSLVILSTTEFRINIPKLAR